MEGKYKYKILTAQGAYLDGAVCRLEKEVHDKIDAGWYAEGGITCVYAQGANDYTWTLTQVMCR